MDPPANIDGRLVRIPFGTVWRNEDGLTHAKCEIARVDVASLKELFYAVGQLNDRRPALTLVDIGSVRSSEALTREHAASQDAKRTFAALALLVGSPVGRVLASFFMRINKPPFAVEMFSDEAKARAWLLGIGTDA